MSAEMRHQHAMNMSADNAQFTIVADHGVMQILCIGQTDCIHEADAAAKGRVVQRQQDG